MLQYLWCLVFSGLTKIFLSCTCNTCNRTQQLCTDKNLVTIETLNELYFVELFNMCMYVHGAVLQHFDEKVHILSVLV